jgi:hypothetical protein
MAKWNLQGVVPRSSIYIIAFIKHYFDSNKADFIRKGKVVTSTFQ